MVRSMCKIKWAEGNWERCGGFAQVSRRALTHKVKCTRSPCSTPVILNCLTLWEHSSLGLFETQEPLRYLKHSFALKPKQTASSSPGSQREDVLLCTQSACGAGGEGGIDAGRRAQQPRTRLPTNAEKQQNKIVAHECPLRKGSLEIAPKIKEGIYPHNCLAEKAIYIVC